MTGSPLYGNQYSKEFLANFYIKAYTTDVTKPADAATALSTFDGVAAVSVFDFTGIITGTGVADGDYLVVHLPTNTYGLWVSTDGVGTKPSAAMIASGCTAFLEVSITTANLTDADAIQTAFVTAINTTKEMTATYAAATDLMTITAVQGGATLADSVTIAATGEITASATGFSLGTGDWMKIGGVEEGYTVETAPVEIKDTVKNTIVTSEDVTINFRFMNVNERNIAILKAINRTQVSIAIVDKSNTSLPKIYCINDLTYNASLNPAGSTAGMDQKLSKGVEDSLEGTDFWTYDTDLA
jgi:hypothetical protein